ncbi:MAG: hypothetical protein K2N26_09350 [Oscillospiraceae bacterium]|nr:hypothetical protein [Oscillospiraceae bacterium]
MIENMSVVTYGKSQLDLINSGFGEVSVVLRSGSEDEKASLLFCLEKFFDPYFNSKLPYEDELAVLLQEMLFENNSDSIVEDIVQLLWYYSKPLNILKDNFKDLPENVRCEITDRDLFEFHE